MKKTVLSILSSILVISATAQKGKAWFELGLKGGGGISIITSKNMWDDKKEVSAVAAGCYSFGGKLAVNLNENHQLAFEYNMGMRSQKYDFLVNKV